MKGNASCHLPNDRYREGWERVFGAKKCLKCGKDCSTDSDSLNHKYTGECETCWNSRCINCLSDMFEEDGTCKGCGINLKRYRDIVTTAIDEHKVKK
jgi:hypothetical protein